MPPMTGIDPAEFEQIVEKSFDLLPEKFRSAIENVGIVVEPLPTDEIVRKMHLRSRYHLLGLYQGIPLTLRGQWYGMSPVAPDRISLYQKNIEASVNGGEELEARIAEVLIHEIGHYFGMSDDEIRKAGY